MDNFVVRTLQKLGEQDSRHVDDALSDVDSMYAFQKCVGAGWETAAGHRTLSAV